VPHRAGVPAEIQVVSRDSETQVVSLDMETHVVSLALNRAPQGRIACSRWALKNNYFTEMCNGFEASLYLRLIDSCIT